MAQEGIDEKQNHALNLRQLFISMNDTILAKLDGLKSIIDERDQRYKERDIANKEAVKAALASAEKASEKTESALKEYKVASNEWRDTVKDLVSKMITRPDVERELKTLENQISDLREYRNKTEGRVIEKVETRTQSNFSTQLTITTIMSGLSLIILVIHLFVGK